MPSVSVPQLSLRFDVEDDQTIVEAAEAQGVPIPFSCHSGTCGTCKARLLGGSVTMLEHYSRFTLTDAERAEGLILPCCALPQTDCEIGLVQSGPIPARSTEAVVAGIRDATHDIKVVQLKPKALIRFLAGQYAELRFDALPARCYSMANRPGEELLEFHIRLVPGGEVTRYVHDRLSVGETVVVNAPMGTSHLRTGRSGPILAVAGGSGLGPIKSIVDELVARGVSRKIYVYFGARGERDLYYHEHFQQLAERNAIVFVPVLSEVVGETSFRRGFLADALASDFGTLTEWEAYLAGPPIMVETCRQALLGKQLSEEHFHADAF